MTPRRISAELLRQLRGVPASRDAWIEYHPCRVTLRDGRGVDRVYVQEAEMHRRAWGAWPDEDPAKRWIPIEEVVKIEESPTRLPAKLASKMYAAGESGMGYCCFALVLRDGSWVGCTAGNAVDFLDLPGGMTMDQVVDLLPHERPKDRDAMTAKVADYAWCLYSNGKE